MNDLRELERLEPHAWRAPSAHNTQPWRLVYAPNRVELRYDPDRALPAGDPTQRDLLLSLGAFVEAVLIASSRAGIAVEFVPDADPAPERVGLFEPATERYETEFTLEDLARRQTSRLAYAPGRLGPAELEDARRQVVPGGELRELPTRDLVTLVREADYHLYGSPAVVAELRDWLRLRPRTAGYEADGLSYDCLALGRVEAAVAGFLLRPRVFPLVQRARLQRLFSASTSRLLNGDGSALVLVGDANSPARVLEHGRALHRVWLALARHGLYTHPLSQILDCPATERELSARLDVPRDCRLLCVFRSGRSATPARSRRLR